MESEDVSFGLVPQNGHSIGLLDPQYVLFQEQAGDIIIDNAHVEPKQADVSSADEDENESAEVTLNPPAINAEEEKHAPLSYELQEGLKILEFFLRKVDPKLTEHFMHAVDDSFPETKDYYEKIDNPMWLTRMQEKFHRGEYSTIAEFVDDFKEMVVNCCRFNGVEHKISKKATKLEFILYQKLNLLRSDIKQIALHSQKVTSDEDAYGFGQRKRFSNSLRNSDTSAIQRQLRMEEEQRAKEARRQKKEDSRAAQLAARQELLDWEERTLTVQSVKMVISHSWELPQIGLFLHLCGDALKLLDPSYYELERCLVMPRRSLRLQKIMTSLLSTPFQRERLEKKMTLMPYRVWTEKLAKKLDYWYKTQDDCHGNAREAAIKLGLEDRAFEVMGGSNPLREKEFHKLSLYKKIWILKCLCDFLTETQESIRSAIENSWAAEELLPMADQRGQVLGTDRSGSLYIHIPQFCGEDLRIYRQRKPPVPSVKQEEEEEEELEEKPAKPKKKAAKRKLNLTSLNGNKSRGSTPLNDSETESTASPAPSETRGRSRGGSSRHSSPMSRETGRRSNQASARNSPAPDTSQDGFGTNVLSGKGRKTRNSAESTFYDVDLEAILRLKSRRGKAAKSMPKESQEAESVRAAGDESSQNGVTSALQASANVLDRDTKPERDVTPPKNIKREPENESLTSFEKQLQKENKSGICSKYNDPNSASRSGLHPGDKEENSDASETRHIKTESSGKTCDPISAMQNSAESDKMLKSCDIKTEPGTEESPISTPVCSHSTLPGVTVSAASNQSSSQTCDSSSIQCAARGNASLQHDSTPSTTDIKPQCLQSVKKENGANDSGFVSFQISPRNGDDGISPSGGVKTELSLSENKNCNYSPQSDEGEAAGKACESAAEDTVKSESGLEEKDSVTKSAENNTSALEEKLSKYIESKRASNETVQGSQIAAAVKALMDHDAYSEEELMPDPEEFELVVSDMEGLDELIKRFEDVEEASPQVPADARSGKRAVQRAKTSQKTVKRRNCEVALHKRLSDLRLELEVYRSRLINFKEKARAKLRREFENFVEETPKVDDTKEWESESERNTEDSEAEDSSEGEEESDDSQRIPQQNPPAPTNRKAPSKAPSTCSMDSSEAEQRSIEEYEMDVSLRGRLRKRRLIPNNIEDLSVKRKKVLKKTEDAVPSTSASHVPNILQKSQGITLGNYSQMAQLQGRLGPNQTLLLRQQGLQVVRCATQGAGVAAITTTTKSGAHPVIQKMLSTNSQSGSQQARTALYVANANGGQKPAASNLGTVAVVPTTQTLTLSGATGGSSSGQLSLLMRAAMPGGKQQVLKLTAKHRELLKSGLLQFQESNQPTQTGVHSSNIPDATKPFPSATTVQDQTQGITAPLSISPGLITSPAPAQGPAGQSPLGQLVQPSNVQEIVGMVPTGQMGSPTKMQRIVGVPASGHVASPLKVPSGAGAAGKPQVILNTVTGNRTLVVVGNPTSKIGSRYAGNVTVKTLLENRNRTEETNSPCGADGSALAAGTVVVTSSSISSLVTSGMTSSAVQRLVSVPLRLPSQSSLDDALQTVVTSYHTTLPTADIKVPSPTTLPSLSPRKNVTHLVQSTKAPIPTTTKLQTGRKSVALMRTNLSGPSATTVGPTAVAAMVSNLNVARPGTVMVPAGQGLTGIDSSGKKPVVLQIIPQGAGGTGNVVQGYILPQNAVQAIQLAGAKTTQTGATALGAPALQLLSNQTASSITTTTGQVLSSPGGSLMANSSGTPVLSNSGDQGLLMVAPTSSNSAISVCTSGTTQKTVTSKTTTEVLKSMLVAKAGGMNNIVTASQVSMATAGASGVATGIAGDTEPSALSGLNQQFAQAPRVIKAQVMGLGASNALQMAAAKRNSVAVEGSPNVLPQTQQQGIPINSAVPASAPVGVQLQNMASLAVAGLPTSVASSSAAVSQNVPTPNLVRMSVPAGVVGLQTGGPTVRLVATGQPGSGSAGNVQPVLATIKPGAQGLQQLQLLASAGGLQRMRLQLTPQQQTSQQQNSVTLQAGTGVGQVVGAASPVQRPQQQQTVQLCFKVQPGRQVVVNSTAATITSQQMPQAVAANIQGGLSVAASAISPHNSSATAAKVIMANQPATIPSSATLQLNPASSLLAPPPAGTPTLLAGLGNRLSMSVTPGPLNSQFTISPLPPQSPTDASRGLQRQLSGSQLEAASSQISPAGSGDSLVNHMTSPSLAVTPQQVQVGVKRRLSSGGVQPIPPKMAHLDELSGNSGAVLASLSQMVGSNMNRNTGKPSGEVTVSSPIRATPGGSVQRIVKAGSVSGDVGASSTLQNLAAQMTLENGAALAVSIPSDTATVTSTAQIVPTQINMAPILQQIAGVAPVPGDGAAGISLHIKSQQALQQKRQLVTVRRVGGQLLTPANVPVTFNNGEVKVLPKATLQMGSQTVTVLSPSSALIQNLKVPTNPGASAVPCQTPVVAIPNSGLLQSSALAGSSNVVPAVRAIAVSNPDSQGKTVNLVKQEIKPAVQSMSADGANFLTQEDVSVQLKRQVHSANKTPVLKARLEQPVVSNSVGMVGASVTAGTVNGVSNGQGRVNMSNSQSTNQLASAPQNSPDNQNEKEEAVLNLLTFANQPVS